MYLWISDVAKLENQPAVVDSVQSPVEYVGLCLFLFDDEKYRRGSSSKRVKTEGKTG